MKNSSNVSEVRSNFIDDNNYLHIDVYHSSNDNEEGSTVAIICLDTNKVFYLDNTYRFTDVVSEVINEITSEFKK